MPIKADNLYMYRLLIISVAVSPLPFGAVHVWAWSFLALTVGTILIVSSIYFVGTPPKPDTDSKFKLILLVFFTFFVAWTFIQVAPFVPRNWHHPLWADTAQILGTPYIGTISLDPEATISALVLTSTYCGVFWLFLKFGQQPILAANTLLIISTAGVIYAIYGIAIIFLGLHHVLWMNKFAYINDLTATFINKNNYATYSGLILLCLIASVTKQLSDKLSGTQHSREHFYVVLEYVAKNGYIYIISILLVFISLLYSHSRGGLLATLIAIISFFCAIALSHIGKHINKIRLFFGIFAVLILIFSMFGKDIDGRLAETHLEWEERPLVYALTLRAIRDQPLLGTGLGTYEEAFRFYRTPYVIGTYDRAHNTYLEAALEIGIPFTLMFLIVFAGLIALLVRGIKTRRRDVIFPCLGFAITCLVAVHSLIDFGVQIPAIAVTYAALLGISVAQSSKHRAQTN